MGVVVEYYYRHSYFLMGRIRLSTCKQVRKRRLQPRKELLFQSVAKANDSKRSQYIIQSSYQYATSTS